MTQENEALVKQYSEHVEQRDWDELRDLVTDDFVVREPQSLSEGPDDIEDHIELLKSFEWDIEVKDCFSDGNKVATREELRAIQIEAFEGLPPSDEEIVVSSILIWRIEEGEVAEVWSSPDSYDMMDQFGMTFPRILLTVPKVLLRKVLP